MHALRNAVRALGLVTASLLLVPSSQAEALSTAQQARLEHLLVHDCGSCHGLRMTGGLGPALTREALAEFPLDSLAAVIFHGRPGTPMPPWKAMLSEPEARWVAQRLQQGFPEESAGVR